MPKKPFLDFSVYRRLFFVAFSLFFFFCILILQFYRVQIVQGEKWTKQALSQHQCLIVEPFMRGRFFSNETVKLGHPEDLKPLVLDIPKFHLFIDPDSFPSTYKRAIYQNLTAFLNPDEKEKAKIWNHFLKKSRSRKIATWLDAAKKEEIEKWWLSFIKGKKIAKNTVFFVGDYKRSYPYKTLLGPVLHTVRDDKDVNKQNIPTGGLELYFNKYLRGTLGYRQIFRSPRNPLGGSKIIQTPENGCDIYLTINQYLQAICEEELAKGVQVARAKGGWVIMLDPKNGEILALAQYPFFDVTNYAKYFNDDKKQELTRVRSISDAFEPASVFKPITMAIALRANEEMLKMGKKPIFDPQEIISVKEGRFPGRSKPVRDTRQHYNLNMYMGLQKSSNIYMCKITRKVIDAFGDLWYKKALEDLFGFGRRVNIELPGETAGQVPTPGKLHPNGRLEWSGSTPYALALGHNIMVSSLQMICAYSVIASKGLETRPTLIRKIVKADGEVIYDRKKHQTAAPRRILSRQSTEELIKSMKYITKFGGTGRRADIPYYSEAGKTGTSEKIVNGKYSNQSYVSSFIGFAPADEPRFVLMIVIDEPEKRYDPALGKVYHGSGCAAPVFREIGQRALEYLGVAPDDPYGYSGSNKRKLACWEKEAAALRKLYDEHNTPKKISR